MNNIYVFVINLLLTIILLLCIIPYLRKLKLSQSVRELGPKTHYVKAGTPTMGGIAIIIGVIITIVLFGYINDWGSTEYQKISLIIIPMILYGIIGFIDDLLIVVKKNNNGLSPNMKLFLQIAISVLYFYLYLNLGYDTSIDLIFTKIDVVWVYGLLVLFMFTSTTNAVNLTDGLDGLATGLVIIALIGFLLIGVNSEIEMLIFTLLGGLVAFLIFNRYPAAVFMGDTGSLSLGAMLASISIVLKKEILLIIIAGVFVLETLSVIAQVIYYKLTKKRIFLMAPIHHHFELKGIHEKIIVISLYMLGILLMFLAVLVDKVFLCTIF